MALDLGIGACAVGASAVGGDGIVGKLTGAVGLAALGPGVATLITESELLLAGRLARSCCSGS